MKPYHPVGIVVAAIVFYIIYVFIAGLHDKHQAIIPYSNHEFWMRIESLNHENTKLKIYADSLLAIPYPTIKETIQGKYEKEVILISDYNSDQLDSTIRANW